MRIVLRGEIGFLINLKRKDFVIRVAEKKEAQAGDFKQFAFRVPADVEPSCVCFQRKPPLR